ncbi:hypothetical protein FQN50_004412 [Emmonsiellopsis sp. PD_5]|nr:hypothetical protein FQN50_004412 [Emmonsiellopsis sp. PD_5]
MSTLNPEWLEFERTEQQSPTAPSSPPQQSLDQKRQDHARQVLQRNATYLDQHEPRLADKDSIVVTDSTVTARDGESLPIRIYDSEQPGNRPVVIFYHGGALRGWNLDTEDLSCRRLAIDGGTVVISIAYRLAPENPYPVPINDAWDGFLGIANNLPNFVPRYMGHAARFVVAGTSSGGHLAAIVSQLAVEQMKAQTMSRTSTEQRSAGTGTWELSGVILRNPVTVYGADKQYIPPEYRDAHQSWVPELDYPGHLDREEMKWSHDLYGVPDSEKSNALAYPLWGNLSGLPPTFVQICNVDILRDDATCYVKGLANAGVDVRSKLYEGLPHVFWLLAPQLEVARNFEQDCVDGFHWIISKCKSE